MNQTEVNKILQEVEDGYNRMAPKFSETRKFFWRDLEFVKEYAKGNVLDYGCGNGRLFELINDKNVEYYGIDVSEKLINICEGKYQACPQAHFQKVIVPRDKPTIFPGFFQCHLCHCRFSSSSGQCLSGENSPRTLQNYQTGRICDCRRVGFVAEKILEKNSPKLVPENFREK